MDSTIAVRDTTVVVPTYNERESIPALVQAVFRLYPEIHLLVVDDQSPDGTAAVVRSLQKVHPNLKLLERRLNHGFAASYRDGLWQALSEARCRAVVMMDADLSHDPQVIRDLVGKLASQDVVVGSRYVPGGSVKNWNWRRRWLSEGANIYVRAALGLPFRDITAGFTCARREALEAIRYRETVSDGYAFQVEMKYRFVRFGQRVAEHPIRFDERREGESKMSAGKMWESLMLPWRIRFGRAAVNVRLQYLPVDRG